MIPYVIAFVAGAVAGVIGAIALLYFGTLDVLAAVL